MSEYVDDIIVSSDDQGKLQKICEELPHAAAKSGLPFNPAKCQGPAESITAFNIELTRSSIEIAAERLEKFATGLAAPIREDRRKGILGYVRSVNEIQAAQLADDIMHAIDSTLPSINDGRVAT